MSLRICASFSAFLTWSALGVLPVLTTSPLHAQTPSAPSSAKKSTNNEDSDPTASLFDAINKGNAQGVQDALNRGADTNAHNVLDQSPLDMAIDLNRYDIAFVLLSMRTYGEENTQFAANKHTQTTTEFKVKSGSKTFPSHKVSHHTITPRVSTHTQFDQTGSTAQPDIGFLGFGK